MVKQIPDKKHSVTNTRVRKKYLECLEKSKQFNRLGGDEDFKHEPGRTLKSWQITADHWTTTEHHGFELRWSTYTPISFNSKYYSTTQFAVGWIHGLGGTAANSDCQLHRGQAPQPPCVAEGSAVKFSTKKTSCCRECGVELEGWADKSLFARKYTIVITCTDSGVRLPGFNYQLYHLPWGLWPGASAVTSLCLSFF